MKKILTVVIPAYNVEKYLERCMHSFEIPEILDKIEILVINDGSKDGTEQIARAYCEKYPQTYFLYNKENGGHGSGINYGIRYATGKYFKVVDGDDWVDAQELKKFVSVLEKQEVDVVASDFTCIQDETYAVLEEKQCTYNQAQYGKCCSLPQGEVEHIIKMHSLTIKTAILQEHQIHMDEKCYYVDCEYITYPIPYVDTVYFYKGSLYQYRLGRQGQSVDIKSMQKNRSQHRYVLEQLLDFYRKEQKQLKTGTKRYMECCIAQVVENEFQIYISMGLKKGIRKELQQWDLELKEKYWEIYAATDKKSITMLRKTNYHVLKLGAVIYKVVKG